MKKKVINGLLTLLAHTTPIYHNDVPLPQAIQVSIFPNATVHTKNATLEGTLILQIFFHGKGEPISMVNT
jgi:hypothetical protein